MPEKQKPLSRRSALSLLHLERAEFCFAVLGHTHLLGKTFFLTLLDNKQELENNPDWNLTVCI